MRVSIHEYVSHFDVKGAGIGIDRNGGYSHPAGGLDHAASNLATIGNQNFLEHDAPGNDLLLTVTRLLGRCNHPAISGTQGLPGP